jgi:DHA2 family multidrug resistance protein
VTRSSGRSLSRFLVDGLGWRWILFIKISFGIIAVAMSLVFLPKNKAKPPIHSGLAFWSLLSAVCKLLKVDD